ncbi:hypothetical protein HK096_004844 [Nowakowskiella sp. JEL0078]|nr:hypothetical protein HK096_004844 [Nowakowskiella sp. JEL0078]
MIPDVRFLKKEYYQDSEIPFLVANDREELYRLIGHIPYDTVFNYKRICIFKEFNGLFFCAGYEGQGQKAFTTTNFMDIHFNFFSLVGSTKPMSKDKDIAKLENLVKNQRRGQSPFPHRLTEKAFKDFFDNPDFPYPETTASCLRATSLRQTIITDLEEDFDDQETLGSSTTSNAKLRY